MRNVSLKLNVARLQIIFGRKTTPKSSSKLDQSANMPYNGHQDNIKSTAWKASALSRTIETIRLNQMVAQVMGNTSHPIFEG